MTVLENFRHRESAEHAMRWYQAALHLVCSVRHIGQKWAVVQER